jgi:hypothetical protein
MDRDDIGAKRGDLDAVGKEKVRLLFNRAYVCRFQIKEPWNQKSSPFKGRLTTSKETAKQEEPSRGRSIDQDQCVSFRANQGLWRHRA